jgi:hypothetical protein
VLRAHVEDHGVVFYRAGVVGARVGEDVFDARVLLGGARECGIDKFFFFSDRRH